MDRKPSRRRPSSIDGFVPLKHLRPRTINRASLPLLGSQPGVAPPQVQRPRLVNSPATPQPSLPPQMAPKVAAKDKPKKEKKPSKHRRLKKVGIVFAILALIGGLYGWKLMASLGKAFHGNLFSDAKALVTTQKLKGEDEGRVNILLAGNSADDPGHDGAQLTDSIMILSLDTKAHTAMMLSIPRDTWVPIPGMGHQKINAANTVDDFKKDGFPDGGMGQLESVIKQNFGIPVHYYALINYSAFRDTVNAVDGITVNIKSPDSRGLYDPNILPREGGPLKMPNGPVNLNGQQALNLARSRGDSYYSYGFPQSDFDRTQHQRQMLVALGEKATTSGVIANPIKVSSLFSAVGKNVKSDLSLANVLRLNQLTKDINLQNIRSLTIAGDGDTELLTNYTAADGQMALVPVAGIDSFNRIQQYYKQLTSNNPVVKEGPTVVVLNGGDVTGLAHKTELALQAKGYNVVGIATAGHKYDKSMIIDLSNGKNPNSLKALKQLAPANSPVATSVSTNGQASEARDYTADFVLVLGSNWPAN